MAYALAKMLLDAPHSIAPLGEFFMLNRWILVLVSLASCCVSYPLMAQNLALASNENAVEQAIAALILTDIYQKAGLTANIEPLPGARASQMALEGMKDGEVARIAAYVTNNPTLIKVEPSYYYLISTAFALKNKGIVINSADDLKKYKVGIVRGIAHSKAATTGVASVAESYSYEAMYKLLNTGRIDIAIDAGVNGIYHTKKLGFENIQPVGELARLDLFNILTSKSKAFAPRITAAINALQGSGELKRLVQKHEQQFLASAAAP